MSEKGQFLLLVYIFDYEFIPAKSKGRITFASSTRISKLAVWALLIKGHCTPNQKLAYFVLYLKIINTFNRPNISVL